MTRSIEWSSRATAAQERILFELAKIANSPKPDPFCELTMWADEGMVAREKIKEMIATTYRKINNVYSKSR
jgi:hypothetical protein